MTSTADAFLGKERLRILDDTIVCAETPAHLLDDEITPIARHFIRNNGKFPSRRDPSGWVLTIDGEVENPLRLTVATLKSQFQPVTLRLLLECAGNGRAGYVPRTPGEPWTVGAVSCAEWTGVRLADVLRAANLKPSAVYTAHYGDDAGPKGDALSRGIPIAKALEPHTLIAFAMNGEPLPQIHGFPLRLIVPGWIGSASQKWLTRIWIRDRVHDGKKMVDAYRIPRRLVVPGDDVAPEDMDILENVRVKSIITSPAAGSVLPGAELSLRGHAWAGEQSVAKVEISIDGGATWQRAELMPPPNKYAWQRWRCDVRLPGEGSYEVMARATDDLGNQQPLQPPQWNPDGYLNNAVHRIEITAKSHR